MRKRVRVESPTEHRNPATEHIDTLDSVGVLELINAEDAKVPAAVAAVLGELAHAVDLAVGALRAGGRVHYFGAGSSGRYCVLDAAEIPPTYGVPADWFVAHLAGGPAALHRSVEEVEDDQDAGWDAASGVDVNDLALGVTASGRTPFVAGALARARQHGAHTVLVSGNPAAPLGPAVDVHVAVDTGPEAITGSTRMKAGAAQKMVLHSFSTAVLVRLGHTYSNLMVDVVPGNAKLRARQVAIVAMATGADESACAAALDAAGGRVRVALVAVGAGVDTAAAEAALASAGGEVRAALAAAQIGRQR
jgi:N-acetylmuramic acid 6-phosphate etherase